MWVRPLGWEDPLEEGMAAHSSILAKESHGQRSLAGYPEGAESDTTEATKRICRDQEERKKVQVSVFDSNSVTPARSGGGGWGGGVRTVQYS